MNYCCYDVAERFSIIVSVNRFTRKFVFLSFCIRLLCFHNNLLNFCWHFRANVNMISAFLLAILRYYWVFRSIESEWHTYSNTMRFFCCQLQKEEFYEAMRMKLKIFSTNRSACRFPWIEVWFFVHTVINLSLVDHIVESYWWVKPDIV